MSAAVEQRFIAIPVKVGDAFYFQRENFRILVDGGRQKNRFPRLFREHVGVRRLDIAVCTHADTDHTSGLIGLLEETKEQISIGELWLPARWQKYLFNLLTMPEVFRSSLLEGLNMIHEDVDQNSAESAGQDTPSEGLSKVEALQAIAIPDHITGLALLADERDDRKLRQYGYSSKNPNRYPHLWPLDYGHFHNLVRNDSMRVHKARIQTIILSATENPVALQEVADVPKRAKDFIDAIDTAHSIRGLVMAASKRSVPIRWFQFDKKQKPTGGLAGMLEPVNARETANWHPPVSPLPPLDAQRKYELARELLLTPVNRESLVFYVPESGGASGVLFAADSDLQFSLPNPPKRGPLLVTAPHHGSDSSAKAYDKLRKHYPNTRLFFVRSGFTSRDHRLASEYLAAPEKRYCTRCPHKGFQQAIHVANDPDAKSWFCGAMPCNC